ncbi:hypothetical protein ACFLTB_05265, partial [Chloroflexota bacterium]
FSVVDIDLSTKTISYNADMKGGISLDEPIQLRLIGQKDPGYKRMKSKGAAGVADYPRIMSIRTDRHYASGRFTWIVAHEHYHLWEINRDGILGAIAWGFEYWLESRFGKHDSWPKEKRANKYANDFYPYK